MSVVKAGVKKVRGAEDGSEGLEQRAGGIVGGPVGKLAGVEAVCC